MSNFCTKCGNELKEGEAFCGKCGTEVNTVNVGTINVNNVNYNNPQENEKTGDTAAMVCGIVGLFVAGIILGIIAIVQANSSKQKTNGVFTSKARAGFILGIIDIVGAIIVLCLE